MSSLLRRAPHDCRPRSRTACALALVCFVLALTLSSTRHAASSCDGAGFGLSPAPESAPTAILAGSDPLFRLGNAARPLGWSTVVSDFNVDGTPDVAVADRLSRRPTGYAYRIQFSISGQQPDDVTFESTSDALTLRVSDVDADNDLDVIITAVLSKETVGVWLNDGHGRFTSSNVRQLPAAIRARQTLDAGDPSSDPLTFDLSPRRTAGGLPALFRAVVVSSSFDRFVAGDGNRVRSTFHSPASGPRAPPAHPADLLS